ncbi:MAG: 4Fe-4S dicluster domain-containing protein [Lachnospiraceae bacterium]|nr:4Fe-4S dicluster domain-containing protein [Lachnospiraceae bacterium]
MNAKKLGFGLMRLPLSEESDSTKVDYGTFCKMADRFIAEGFTYFDTAAPYHGGGNSEIAFRECVAKRFARESYTITNKLSFSMVKEADKLEEFFSGQLERCGVEYFDYYLLHAMKKEYLELAESIGAFEFAVGKKAEGKIRHVGFSFHDKPEVLDEILTKHPEMEVVQLQLNYIDWEDPDVQARRCYEICVRHNKPVIVMEPVKGGLLANITEDADHLFKEAAPNQSAASWAVRYAASLEKVVMVLSGMSSPEQMEDNLSYMREFKPLTDAEKETVQQAAACIREKASIACTACRYCVDGCPKKIAIPDYFKLMNEISKFGDPQVSRAKNAYVRFTETLGMGKASECIKCGQCEGQCPQHLPITKYLEQTAQTLE